jgi:hypothetical protein
MCFDYEIPNSLKAKNKEKAFEDAELEPELEKVEEQPILSKSQTYLFLFYFHLGNWGWPDLNRRPPAPEAGILTKLDNNPNTKSN